MNSVQLERINQELRGLFPQLRDALRREHGAQLDAWLERGTSSAVEISERESPDITPWMLWEAEDIQGYASELFAVEMKGYDGFIAANFLTPQEILEVQQQAADRVRDIIRDKIKAGGLKRIIDELRTGVYDDRAEVKQDAAFFIWAAIVEDGQPHQMADLLILEHSPEFHDYIFLIEDGARMNQSWRVLQNELSSEAVHALDLEYIGIEDEAAA